MAFGDNQKESLYYNLENYPVKPEWIFEKLLNLSEKLVGQSVTIHSMFNKNDTDPSMIIYYCNKQDRYKFKDFSSGLSGEAVELIQYIYDFETRNEAYHKGLELYKSDDNVEFTDRKITPSKKEITKFKIRKWNIVDQEYWSQYYIGSKQLEYYNIYPLKYYQLTITTGNIIKNKIFDNPNSYGYFNKKGKLIKIYNPKNSMGKFIKVSDYIQGHDQLKYKSEILMILSGMKDLLAFKILGFPNIECIAGHSENHMLSKKEIEFYKNKYKHLIVLFDNDGTGLNCAKKYKTEYEIPYIDFKVEKDIAECVKQHGIKNSKLFLKPKLIEQIKLFKKQL